MQNPASPNDVESRWRPLTAAEARVAQTRLNDGWRSLQRKVPALVQRMGVEKHLTLDVVRVLADATIRVLRNPDGVRSGSVAIDDATRTFDYGSTGGGLGGGLYFTQDELDDLSPLTGSNSDGRAFSVMPS